MPDLAEALDAIAASRQQDPLAVTTVIVPSRLAALQLRRRLAERGAFAGVRFEPLSRLAELIAAAELARQDRRPLARPIADYVSSVIARESRTPLHLVHDLPGYARALRQAFRRFRRGGIRRGDQLLQALPDATEATQEVARLYTSFRDRTVKFYDDQDLLETAADVLQAFPGVLPELGDVYVVPPSSRTAGEAAFLAAIRRLAASYVEVDESPGAPEQRLILAPDATSEARSVVRSVLEDLKAGAKLDEVAVFYSGDRSYRPLLAESLAAAGVPVAAMPGRPLIELPAGRGALALARLALDDYSRVATFDFFGLAPLRRSLPVGPQRLQLRDRQWLRIAREAGVTAGLARWRDSLRLFEEDLRTIQSEFSEASEWRRNRAGWDIEEAGRLRQVIEALAGALEPLRRRQQASEFIPPFRRLIEDWFDPAAEGLADVLNEVDQLGTIDAVQGSFDLASFVDAFEANLTLAALRENRLGEGVLVVDHRQASGLRFERVYLCGAYEGALPAIATSEALLQDDVWARLRESYTHVEDLELRAKRSREAVERVLASAEGGVLTWSAPVQAAGGTREYYPSALMTEAARGRDAAIRNASELRSAGRSSWLLRPQSPLSALLSGEPVDVWELRLRETVALKAGGGSLIAGHPLHPAHTLIRARKGSRFAEFDGNLAGLEAWQGPDLDHPLSPTALETFASCGFRYFLGSVLRLRAIDEPDEGQTINAADRGSLVHATLERFFQEQHAAGRPAAGERWTSADRERLLEIFEEEWDRLRLRGRTGLDVFSDFDRGVLRADLATFLDRDSDYRIAEGVVPDAFEPKMEPARVGEVQLSGRIDRIDRSPDRRRAVVIDYKTGSTTAFESKDEDPLKGGTKLQLPVYSLAVSDAEVVTALYWFIGRRSDFKQIPYAGTAENRRRFEETLEAILAGMRAGSFPAVPGEYNDFYGVFDNCSYCEFTRLCSRFREQEFQNKQADRDVVAWLNVGRAARGEAQP
jgi:RecB family exonuclease